jgi:hypothetical protein
VYLSNQNVNVLAELFTSNPINPVKDVKTVLSRSLTYSPMLRFILFNEKSRLFIVQRYCFLGSVDDWINIGLSDTLQNLVETYVQHLGRESYYELH